MKLLLNMFHTTELSKGKTCTYPLGLLSIAAYLKKRIPDIEIKIIDGVLEVEDVKEFNPDIIGLSLLSPFFTMGVKKVIDIKKFFPTVPVFFGGHHISYIPENLPPECAAGILGEGEESFYQICRILHEKGNVQPKDLALIKNIAYWESGILKKTEKSNDLIPTDQIPLINNYEICTFKSNQHFHYHIIVTRGCPYQCRFCSSSPFWKRVRYYPVDTVINQIEYIINKFDPEMINFYDDLMIANQAYLRTLHDEVIKRKLHEKTTFTCWGAGKHLTEDVVRMLKEMNFTSISFGVESGSPEVYRYLKGDWNTPEKNEQAIKLAHLNGLLVNISVIVGAPLETPADLEKTYRYVKKLPIDSGSVGLLKPFPGTTLWKEMKEKGVVCDSMDDWSSIESDDILNEKTYFLGEKSSRQVTYDYYMKLKKLLHRKQLFSILKKRAKKIFLPRYWFILLRRVTQ